MLTLEIAVRRTDYFDYDEFMSSSWRLMYRVNDADSQGQWSAGESFLSRLEAERARLAKLETIGNGSVALADGGELGAFNVNYNPHGLV